MDREDALMGEALSRSIAIVGMAGRFPGADDLETFWRNLCDGVESIVRFSRQELAEAGIDPDWLEDPRYVRASGWLDGIEEFDASFFNISSRDAELIDPQHRLFLECCWRALEHAGYDAITFDGLIGVYGGCGASDYLFNNLQGHRDLLSTAGILQLGLFNNPDFLTSLVAFKLGLNGPCISVQSACATGLVAANLACQSLLSYQCDAALAGAVSLTVPAKSGYLSTESVLSPDGQCRAFDASAKGTVVGNGGGVVVLRRLEDALADGDNVLAVIRGFANNNDGAYRSSYAAPSVDGQMEVIVTAQAMAGVEPETITYVEGHGTGTRLGDPIEVTALTEAFASEERGFCGLGSIKTNIGHLDSGAGMAGMFKTVLALEHAYLPPTLHFKEPNPQIDFASSPFYVVAEGQSWQPPDGLPRRAGLSSFGLGGSNAHLILEQTPPQAHAETMVDDPPRLLLLLSAATETAREAQTRQLVEHLEAHPEQNFADVAHTLQVGRKMLPFRRALLCRDRSDALEALKSGAPERLLDQAGPVAESSLAFLFPGLGHHYPGMARGLYEKLPVFKQAFDQCAEILEPLLDQDLRDLLFTADGKGDAKTSEAGLDLRGLLGRGKERDSALAETRLSQPTVFAVEYALARLLEELGLQPQALLGFSIGEYVAACLAEVLTLEDALYLVAERARLISELPRGAMLAVPLPEKEVRARLGDALSLAAQNGPELSVVAGPVEAIAKLEQELNSLEILCRRLDTEHAFHSSMMEPIAEAFRALVASVELLPPRLPLLSNVTGTWMTDEQATDPDYWVAHLCQTVRFGDAVGELWQEGGRVMVEVGPGQTLSSWALQHPAAADQRAPLALPTLRHDFDRQHDLGFLLNSLGRLWLAGQPIDWRALWQEQGRRRVPLPTYPFEKKRYWIDPPANHRPFNAIPSVRVALTGDQPAPEALVEATALPLVPGQVDAQRRPGAHPRPALAVPYVAPRKAIEATLAQVFSEVLHLDEVGILDSFFDLGGDSLQATTLLGRLRVALDREISLPTLFEHPTVVDLAKALDLADEPRVKARAAAPLPALGPRGTSDPAPLSFGQQRMWFLAELEPDHPGYNHPLVFDVEGDFDISAFAAALSEITRRHEILRSTFERPPGQNDPVQIVHSARPIHLQVVDLTSLAEADAQREGERRVRQLARFQLDLSRPPGLFIPWLFSIAPKVYSALLLMHHIVADGWSMGVLAREIDTLYRAALDRHPSPLPELPIQVADVAAWQRQFLNEERIAQELDYWRDQLADAPALELPHDRPGSARGGHRPLGIRRNFFLGEEGTQGLVDLATRHETTPFVALLSLFQTWLYRQTGQPDLAIGTPVAGRRHPDTENLIGFFVNTLVLRRRVEPRQSTHEAIVATREMMIAAQAHQDLPFERLVEALQPERDLNRTPFFQVMLAWQSAPEARLELPGITITSRQIWQEAALFDLTLSPVLEVDQCLHGYFEVDGQRFDATTAERMSRQIARLLAAAAHEPDRAIAELSFLSDGEAHQLLTETQAHETQAHETQTDESPRGGPVLAHQRVLDQAMTRPETIAIVEGTRQVSYGELARRATSLAWALRGLGLMPDQRVGLGLRRSCEQIVAYLAIWLARGSVLPLDPAYPSERLALMAEDGDLSLLFVEPATRDLPTSAPRVEVAEIIASTTARPLDPPSRENLAYLLFTSGSTGRPKGVAVSHRVLANLISWQLRDLPTARRTLQFAALGFDVSFQEILSTLGGGGSLVLVDEERRVDPAALWTLLAEQRIERLFMPFVALQQLAETLPENLPPSLVEVITAGEKLRATSPIRAWFERSKARLHNHYGPTETHAATAFQLGPNASTWPDFPAIGRAIDGSRLRVLDAASAPAPLGVVGELFLGGEVLARGYFKRPAGTAERFLPDPFSPQPGARLYRTGDLVRWLVDGQLHFLGRRDHQVKVRGFRVEPAEIEAALASLPEVKDAAVVARGEAATARLIAFCVPAEEGAIDGLRLRDELASRLPDHLVPSQCVMLDALPLLPSGKVDRLAVKRRPLNDNAETRDQTISNPDEAFLAEQIATLLDLEQVGRDDDFFVLGGHSLLATRLMARLRTQFEIDLPVRALFEAPTPALLARKLRATRGDGPTFATVHHTLSPPEIRRGHPRTLPLSFAQERLWFLDQLQPGSPVYNMPMALHLRGAIEPARLERALRAIGQRHETLRTTFGKSTDGKPRQIINGRTSIRLDRVDLSRLDDPAKTAHQLAEIEALRAFDLERGPLWRALVLRLAEQEHVLLLTLHHIISDGWSLGVLAQEIATLYDADAMRQASDLPAQYADYTLWQRQALQGEALARELDFWRERLADAPASLELPADRPRQKDRSWRGSSIKVRVPEALEKRLRQLGRERGATLFMVLLAAYKAWLHRLTQATDLVVGSPIAGRQREEYEALIGFFVNTLALRGRVDSQQSFAELIDAEREITLAAYAHQNLPFEKLVEELRPERVLGQTPLFQVLLVLQNTPIPSLSLPDLELTPFETDGSTAKFDLSLNLDEASMTSELTGLEGWLVYASDLFDDSTAERFKRQILNVLDQASHHPDRPLAKLSLLDRASEQQILIEWNDRPRPSLFANTTPLEDLLDPTRRLDTLAVVTEKGALSYREFHRRAEQLAFDLNVTPETRIGLGLEPGLDQSLTLLALAKAGACCVPLDPDYPEERLKFVLGDCLRDGIVLTDHPSLASLAAGLSIPIRSPQHRRSDGSHAGHPSNSTARTFQKLSETSATPAGQATGGFGGVSTVAAVQVKREIADTIAIPEARLEGPRTIDPKHPLYILYTSGSTGQPKAIALPRRAFTNLLLWHRDHRLIGVRTSQFAPLSFDASFHEIFATWTTGGTLHPVPSPTRRDVPALDHLLATWRIEKATVPGLVLQQLASLADRGQSKGLSLREVITSGEQLNLTPTLIAWMKALANRAGNPVPLHNQYGPSESHMVSAETLLARPDTWSDSWETTPAIGRPIPNARLNLVDPHLRPVPLGAVGELMIGGKCLARGYFNRPALTAERFVPDPLSQTSGERLYRTGDLARQLQDGRLLFLGRRDQQIKLHGVRIEIGDIEAQLNAQPAVRAAAVHLRQEGNSPRLIAHLVAHEKLDVDPLRQALAQHLPRAMVPTTFVEVDALPLLPNGKVDRRALHTLQLEETPREAPRGDVELSLAALWSDLLGCPLGEIHRQSDFFAAGGHSLLATQLVARIASVFGNTPFETGLDVRSVFEAPTLAELAQTIKAKSQTRPTTKMRPVPRDRALPASFAQQRLWFLDALMPNNPFYNFASAVLLRGQLDLVALQKAVGDLVRRHESLRTVFAKDEDAATPRQILLPWRAPELPLIDFSALAPRDAEVHLGQVAREESRRPYDLERGPLLRLHLLRVNEREHTLIFNLHHIITDGWSLGVMFRDLAELYAASSQKRAAHLPGLAIQYADYSVWQRDFLAQDALDPRSGQLNWWRQQLDGLPDRLELPLDHPRPVRAAYRGRSYALRLNTELRQQVVSLARQQASTPAMVLLAAYEALLHRLAGQPDLAVGMAIANRRHEEIENLIGLFVNTLVIRSRVTRTFRELLAHTREACLGAYSHQDLPFEHLVEALDPERDLARNPLVQAMFAYQNYPRPKIELSGLELLPPAQKTVDPGTSKFDLTLLFIEDPQMSDLQGALEIDAELFDPTTAQRLIGQFQALLRAALERPEARLDELTWLSQAESHQLLREWNGETSSYPSASLDEIFFQRAATLPDAIAVVDRQTWLSHGRLAQQAGSLARFLIESGLETEERVALCFERQAEWIVAILAVWRAGGAYLPLDIASPAERLLFMIENSGASVLLHHQRTRDLLPPSPVTAGLRQICLDETRDLDLPVPEGPRHAEQLAYTIYTSGSTGRPKGVLCHHGGLMNMLRGFEAFALEAEDRAASWGSLSFDVSLYEFGTSLMDGVALHLVPGEIRGESTALFDWLKAERIGHTYLPPFLLGDLEASAERLALKRLLVGVEPISKARLTAISQAQTGLTILNAYGPTEATVCCTFHPIRNNSRELASPTGTLLGRTPLGRTPLGRAMVGTSVELLDASLNTLPIGARGEIFIGGRGVARGYLRRPGRTAWSFLPDPHAEKPGARLYRTGDLARRLPTGDLEFLGRRDHQVKVAGLRVELGEIETWLATHPSVREALVITREVDGVARLVGFALMKGNELVSTGELQSFLGDHLPRSMVPTEIHWLDAWPQTQNGKIDRRALDRLAREQQDETHSVEPPSSETEQTLAKIWAEVLDIQPQTISRGSDFFALGGHSLLAAQVIARLREYWGVDLPLRALFEAPTLAQLAAELDRLPSQQGTLVEAQERPASDKAGVFPLSFAQERLWFIDQLQPWSSAYNLPLAVRLGGRLDVRALASAFRALAERHEALRTTLVRLSGDSPPEGEHWHEDLRRGQPAQRIAPTSDLRLVSIDLSALRPETRVEEQERLAETEAQRPFDLASGPLLRVHLLWIEPGEAILLLTLHHITGDAWSMRVLIQEVATLYRAATRDEGHDLAPLTFQYADYALWQRRFLAEERLDAELGFWRRALEGAPPALELPSDRPRPMLRSGRGTGLGFAFAGQLGETLQALAKQQGATLFMLLLAAFQEVLKRHSQQQDFTVGTPVAGRRLAKTEALIGFFVNTLVLRSVPARGSETFVDLLARIRDRALDAFAHQDLPFERLVETLQPRRDPGQTPLFNVLFALQTVPVDHLEVEGLSFTGLNVESGVTRFDLGCSITPTEGRLEGRLTFSRDLYDPTTMERLKKHFETLLQALPGGGMETPLASLSFLSEAEQHQLRQEWNDTQATLHEPRTLHELVEAQARKHPDRLAVVDEDGSLTYAQLDLQADRLATRLRIAPETPIAIAITPSIELIVGALAILKAGGVYFPLDPNTPKQRLDFLLADTQAPILLTRSHTAASQESVGITIHDVTNPSSVDNEGPEAGTYGREKAREQATCRPEIHGQNLAYLIYTSGSTGTPKAVLSTHRGLVNRLQTVDDIREADHFLQRSSPTFDAATREIFWPLVHGAKLNIASENTRKDPKSLIAHIQRERITIAGFVPTLLAATAKESELAQCLTWRKLISGGEVLPRSLAKQVQKALPNLEIHNRYGPSEASTLVSGQRFEHGQDGFERDQDGDDVPIGRPHPNNQLQILSRHLETVPLGALGELCLGGVQLARGYLNRPAKTAESFVPDPSSQNDPGARLYRSGDLARQLNDGRLLFVGRRDHQVKIRGFRVEPGEIETCLQEHASVRTAAVTTDPQDDRRLVAHVVGNADQPIDVQALRSHLAERLPDYMIPSLFNPLDRLPKLASGKIDRRALQQTATRQPSTSAKNLPQNQLERQIAQIWQEVLNIDQVGLDDGFFELGGHSLLLVELRAKLEESFARSLPLAELFNHSTVAEQARWLGASEAEENEALKQVEATQEKVTAGKARRQQRLARRKRLAKGDA